MSALDEHQVPTGGQEKARKGGHSRLMMLACCLPMLAIAVLVALSGGDRR